LAGEGFKPDGLSRKGSLSPSLPSDAGNEDIYKGCRNKEFNNQRPGFSQSKPRRAFFYFFQRPGRAPDPAYKNDGKEAADRKENVGADEIHEIQNAAAHNQFIGPDPLGQGSRYPCQENNQAHADGGGFPGPLLFINEKGHNNFQKGYIGSQGGKGQHQKEKRGPDYGGGECVKNGGKSDKHDAGADARFDVEGKQGRNNDEPHEDGDGHVGKPIRKALLGMFSREDR
jgi:hypothetical protein